MESYYKQNKKLITDILDILEGHFGKNVEFVVHDLSLDYEHTIVDIRNGEVTGRKVGGTGDLLGLRALRYNGSNEGNCFNTLTYAENGKILRSSTLFFRNGAGVAVASIAINEDVTESIKYEQYLHKQNRTEESGDAMELYRGDVNKMLDYLINSALLEVGKKRIKCALWSCWTGAERSSSRSPDQRSVMCSIFPNLRCIIIWKRSARNLDRNDEGSHFIDEDLAPGCQCRQPGFLFYRIGRKAMT